MKRVYYVAWSVGVFGSLLVGVQALTAQPRTEAMEPTCYYCICDGRCVCYPISARMAARVQQGTRKATNGLRSTDQV